MKKELLKYKAPSRSIGTSYPPQGELGLELQLPVCYSVSFKRTATSLPFGKGFSVILHLYKNFWGWAFLSRDYYCSHRLFVVLLFSGLFFFPSYSQQKNYISKVWVADNGNGTYKNPV